MRYPLHTDRDVRAAAQSLCGLLAVPPCGVESSGNVNGSYDPRTRTIDVSRTNTRGLEASMLHQVAHYVADLRGFGPWHDEEFVECLREVLAAWFGASAQAYPWETEQSDFLRRFGAHVEEL